MPKKVNKNLRTTQKSWVCSSGCDISHSICSHMEKYLPQMGDGKIPFSTTNLENLKGVPVFNESSQSEEEFLEQIKAFGIIDAWDKELLVAYFVEGKSTYEIAAQKHYVSHETVRRHINKLKKLLKERGYGKSKVRT